MDGMLGRLARWLRLTGHDVLYVNELDLPPEKQDEFLLQKSRENYIVVTSDRSLYQRVIREGGRASFIQSSELTEQLIELSREVPLEINLEESRCPLCNGELEEVGRDEVAGAVPRSVLQRHELFWRCVRCGKIYWQGTHWKNILATLEEFEKKKNEA